MMLTMVTMMYCFVVWLTNGWEWVLLSGGAKPQNTTTSESKFVHFKSCIRLIDLCDGRHCTTTVALSGHQVFKILNIQILKISHISFFSCINRFTFFWVKTIVKSTLPLVATLELYWKYYSDLEKTWLLFLQIHCYFRS